MSSRYKRHKRVKTNGVAGRFVTLCAPFLLYAVAICFIYIFIFNIFVESNPLWRAFISDGVGGSENINDEWEQVSPAIFEREGEKYYSLDEFPSIPWGKKWAKLTIPYLKAQEVPIYNGDTDSILNLGVGHSFSTPFPGTGGNCVISFHVNRQKFLYYLEDLPVGELIIFDTVYGKYVYKVTSKDIFASNDPSLLMRDEGEMVTIYTCYPKQGPYRKKRIAITGRLVESQSDPQWR